MPAGYSQIDRVPGTNQIVDFEGGLSHELRLELLSLIQYMLGWNVSIDFSQKQTVGTLKEAIMKAGTVDEDDLAVLCLHQNWPLLKEALGAELALPHREKTR